jgi:hypothetical protein
VARLNAPSKVGQSDAWSNLETKSSGTSTILRRRVDPAVPGNADDDRIRNAEQRTELLRAEQRLCRTSDPSE